MGQTAELLTRIMAENAQFKAKMKESEQVAKQTSSKINKSMKDVAKGFAFYEVFRVLKQSSEQMDSLVASARKLDVGVQNLDDLRYAAKRSDVEVATLERGLKRLRTSAEKAKAGNKEILASFKELGIGIDDLNKPVDELYTKVSDGFKGKSTGRQVGIVNSLFGVKDGQEQLNLLRSGIKELVQESRSLGGIVSDSDVAKFEAMDKATDRIATTISRDIRNGLIALAPLIEGIAKAFVLTSKGTSSFISEISRGISEGATEVRNLVKGDYQNTANKKQSTLQNMIADASTGGSRIPNLRQGSDVQTFGPVIEVPQELSKLAIAAQAATSALNSLGKNQLSDLLGISDITGKGYLSSILKEIPQAQDETFTKLANQLRDIVASGGNPLGVPFQSGLALMEKIAQDAGLNNGNGTTNSGMVAAVKELKEASKLMKNKQEVRVVVYVKDNSFIDAVVESAKFAESVTQQAVKAADESARGAVR